VEKRKILEAIDVCVRTDLLTEIEADQIMQICYTAIGRAIREEEEGET
jgi:hypothetical protein